MFYRKVIEQLQSWADNPKRKPLVLRGARQVGKTTVVEVFAKDFDTFLHLNLDRDADRQIFDNYHAATDVLTAIYLYKNKLRKSGRTLLFIDEIQNSPKAVALMRYFYEDIPDLYVIAAGSLLETLINRQIVFPVGRVEYMVLRPCPFSEFLGALGETQLRQSLLDVELPAAIHQHVMKLFNEYALTGGMPEIVASYAEKRDWVALRKIYDTIVAGYQDDTEKYARNDMQRNALRHILMYGWHYAAQRIKFERFANSNYKSREMGEAFRTLEKAMLLELSYPTTSTDLPIIPDLNKSPKLLWVDTGIVNHIAGLQQEIFGIQNIGEAWRGRIAEHIVAQGIISNNYSALSHRNFWVRDAKNSQAEVDFVIQYGTNPVPVEVKSGDNSKMKSLHLFMEQSTGNVAVRFWNQPLSRDTVTLPSGKKYLLLNIPYYYAECMD
ncbi:MAG: AAA family ATPase, partial [Tannerella sp.]|nr:AAA family ATPase [Tannerella sp.]